ncbi:hypothetical protein CesoFtcFv8_021707 [Champsocephalus esox]|uniref:TGF-beta family profile domain-containing protein n=1 Tax=Champsocephalus esox TaxID=159716 RepID=A0AAN8B913_9TELE|nr:hypothetical protein CesoFtcFv8_021707 [Champsocephalus esox]
MTAGALRLWVLLALRMRCVTLLALPLDRGTAPGREHGVDTTEAGEQKAGRGRPRSQKDILEGNTVRSFEDKANSGERLHFFNLSSVGREERMIKAEFRWFRKKQKVYLGKSFGPHFYKVDLYDVLDSRVKPWRGNLITSRLVPLHTQGWEVFNFTQTVSKWIRNSQENNGILVVTTLPSGSWMESARSPSYKRSGELMDTNAYLVLFSDDDEEGRTGASNQSFLGQPHPAAPELQDPHSRRWRASPGQPHPAAPELQDPHSRRRRASPGFHPHSRSQSCQRLPLFVDFEEIGWSGWIISPRGYNAYHCKGSCPFPLGGSLKATNHATVRSIMHALKLSSDEVEAPCCVPDKLQSISLLYFDDEENVVLKQYDDMVALGCGCH